MSSDEQEIVFTRNNHKLLDLAKIADIFFWLAIIALPIMCYTVVLQNKSSYDFDLATKSTLIKYWKYLIQEPTQGIYFLGELLHVLVRTSVFILVFKAISLGLRMIVETDVNYRLSKGE